LAGSAAYAVGEAFRWPVGPARQPKEARAIYGTLAVARTRHFTSADRVRTILNAPRGDRQRMPKAVDKGQRKSLAFGNSRRGGEWMGEGHDKIGPRDYLLPLVDACLRRMLYFHS